MAIAIEQSVIAQSSVVSTGVGVTIASPPTGQKIVTVAGSWFVEAVDQLQFTSPSGTTTVLDEDNAVFDLGGLLGEFDTTGATLTSVDMLKAGTSRIHAIGALVLSDAGNLDVSDTARVTSGLTVACTTSTNVTSDNSLAVFFVLRRSRNESGSMAFTYSNGFSELHKVQTLSADSNTELYIATKTVNSGAPATCTWNTSDGTAAGLLAFLVVYPPANTNPAITAPTSLFQVTGGDQLTGLAISDLATDNVSVTFSASQGTFTMPGATAAGITVDSGSGTQAILATGNPAAWDALFAQGYPNGVVYTNPSHTSDTVVVQASDQSAGVATSRSIAITMVDFVVKANTMADLNASLSTLTVTSTELGSQDLILTAEDLGGRMGIKVLPLTTEAASGGGTGGGGTGGGGTGGGGTGGGGTTPPVGSVAAPNTTQFTTFHDLYIGVLNAVRSQTTQASTVSQAKRAVNVALQDMHLGTEYQFYWAERSQQLVIHPPYSTGTVEITTGTTRVVGTGTLWNTASTYGEGETNIAKGWKLTFPGSEVVYRVLSIEADTILTLDSIYVGPTLTASTYFAFKDEYALPADYLRPVSLEFFDENREICLIDRRRFLRNNPRNSITGRPHWATQIELGPSGGTDLRPRIVFSPPPDAVYTIPFHYITSYLVASSTGFLQDSLIDDDDEPIVPLRYRHGIYYYALKMFYEHKDDVRRQEAQASYENVMRRTLSDVTVGDRRMRVEPQVSHYHGRAERPYGGGGRFDTNGRFDRME